MFIALSGPILNCVLPQTKPYVCLWLDSQCFILSGCWRGIEEDLRADHSRSDERVSSVARAHYHVCVGSERDDSFHASCRRKRWSAELHIDFCAIRGALVVSLTSCSLSTYLSWIQPDTCGPLFWLSHKHGNNHIITVSWSSGVSF